MYTTVRVQTLGGVWENIGSDRARGVWFENLVAESDRWGNSTASFDLHRAIGFIWPDIAAFTPVEIDRNGTVVWTGRIKETPQREGSETVINVQCEGWQFHLDDDLVERTYVHTKLSEYRDIRTYPGVNLVSFSTGGQVSVDQGALTIGWTKGSQIVNGEIVGVMLDLGPNPASWAKRIVFNVDNITGWPSGDISLYARGGNEPALSGFEDFTSFVMATSPGNGVFAASVVTPRRYVAFFMYYSGAGGTFGQNVSFRINGVQAFSDAAYESGNVSILKASTVISDVVTRGTALLSSDQSLVQATSSNIPEYTAGEPRTPRQHWEAMDAFHDYTHKIDAQKRPVYKSRPSVPLFEVGGWSAGEFQDASANSGENIYNRGLVTGTSPDGFAIRSARTAVGAGTAPTVLNPSFTVDTSNWSSLLGITRDTTVFDSTPASGLLTTANTIPLVGPQYRSGGASTVVQGVIAGQSVRVTFRARGNQGVTDFFVNGVYAGSAGAAFSTMQATVTMDASTQIVITGVSYAPSSATQMWIDTFSLALGDASIPTRRGFTRTKQLEIQAALPTDLNVANTIGDVWLPNHKTTPFKGSYTAYGRGTVRDARTGQTIDPALLLLNTDELLRFSDRPDPDTGNWGRSGRMTQVRWTEATDTVEITLDNSRQNFEAFLARFELGVGQFA